MITEEIIEMVHNMILAYGQMKVCEVTEAVGVSYGTVFNILYGILWWCTYGECTTLGSTTVN